MKKRILPLKSLIFMLSLCSISITSLSYLSGPPAGNTNAPSESNCTSCHSGTAITSGSNWDNLTMSGLPSGGYALNTNYTLTLSYSQSGISRYGFQMTALGSSNAMAGSFTAGSGSQIVSGSGRSYIEHTSGGSSQTSWTFTWTSPASASGTVTFYVAVNATNNNSATNGDQIYVKTFTLSQGGLPTAVITPSATTICLGDTLYLQGSGANNPTTYNWTFVGNPNPSSSTQQNPKILYATAGFKTIRLVTSNAAGSSPTSQVIVNVVAKPSASITATNAGVVCDGDSVTLTANAGNGYTYLWTPGNKTTQSITVADSGNYSVKVTNSSGCFANSTPFVVSKRAKPNVSISLSKDSICADDSLSISGSSGLTSYAFYRNDTLLASSNNNSLIYKGSFKSGNVYVVGTNVGCGSQSQTKSIKVFERLTAPSVSCGSTSPSSIQYTWAALSGATGYEVSADTGKTWMSANGSGGLSHTLNGLSPGVLRTLQVRALDASPCAKGMIALKSCANSTCPKITLQLDYARKACLSSDVATANVNIKINNIGSSSPYKISFASAAYGTQTSKDIAISKGINNVNISVIDTANSGCVVADTTLAITGYNSPASPPLISLSKPGGVYCDRDTVIITSTAPNGTHMLRFLKNDSISLHYSTANIYANIAGIGFNNNDNIKVFAIDTVAGCSKASATETIQVKPNPVAGFTTAVIGLNVQFDDTTASAASRVWNFGDGSASDTNKVKSYTYAAKGTYTATLTVTSPFGCKASSQKTINVFGVGLDEQLNEQLAVYPNPANDKLFVAPPISSEQGILSIYDFTGKLVLQQPSNSPETTVDIGALGIGPHLLLLQTQNKTYQSKFIKH